MAENESKNVKEKNNTLGKSALMAWAYVHSRPEKDAGQ